MRKWATLAMLCAGAAAAALAGGAGAVSGGKPVSIRVAPWTVFVSDHLTASTSYDCTGSILDARHVLTAAHCLFTSSGQEMQPSQLGVVAGVSNVDHPLGSDVRQDRAVASVRIHPRYHWTATSSPDDVAVLVLSHPLALGRPTARAIALPPASLRYPAGSRLVAAGFGQQSAAEQPSGDLVLAPMVADPEGICDASASGGTASGNAVTICVSSPQSATCHGDSGSGLVAPGRRPELLGVLSGSVNTCVDGSHSAYTYLGAGEIRRFVLGDAHPPVAPRLGSATYVHLSYLVPLQAGQTLRCDSGNWGVKARIAYSFVSPSGRLLQRGPTGSYAIPSSEVGTSVYCLAAATNAGGTEYALTAPTPVIEAAS